MTDKTGLNCRSGAGISYPTVKTYPYGTGLTITRITNTNWGFTGEGWINLTNTEKVAEGNTGKENELDMTKKEFIESLTNEEAYELLAKAMAFANSKPEPGWSREEGSWERATAKGAVNGGAPEGYIKRDEFAAVLDRLGLL